MGTIGLSTGEQIKVLKGFWVIQDRAVEPPTAAKGHTFESCVGRLWGPGGLLDVGAAGAGAVWRCRGKMRIPGWRFPAPATGWYLPWYHLPYEARRTRARCGQERVRSVLACGVWGAVGQLREVPSRWLDLCV